MALPKLDTPKYKMTIPSTGETIEYRPYLVREEKLLMIAMESEDESQMVSATKDIISSCTFEKVDVNNLTTFDVEYLFMVLRSKSVGENVEIAINCDNCEHPNKYQINIDTDIQVKKGGDKKIQLNQDTGMIMRYPSMADYLDIVNSDRDEIDKIFDILAKSIESVYSGDEIYDASEQSQSELVDFLEHLSSDQYVKVREFLDNAPQAYATAKFKCESCGTDNEVEVKGLRNFFS